MRSDHHPDLTGRAAVVAQRSPVSPVVRSNDRSPGSGQRAHARWARSVLGVCVPGFGGLVEGRSIGVGVQRSIGSDCEDRGWAGYGKGSEDHAGGVHHRDCPAREVGPAGCEGAPRMGRQENGTWGDGIIDLDNEMVIRLVDRREQVAAAIRRTGCRDQRKRQHAAGHVSRCRRAVNSHTGEHRPEA